MRRAAKPDDNQNIIVAFFRKAGATVQIVHMFGKLGCDLLVSYQGVTVFVEVKDGSKPPSKQELTDSEQYLAGHADKYAIINSIEQAKTLLESISVYAKAMKQAGIEWPKHEGKL